MAEARLRTDAAIEAQFAETIYTQLRQNEEDQENEEDAAATGAGPDDAAPPRRPTATAVDDGLQASAGDAAESAASADAEPKDGAKDPLEEATVPKMQPVAKTVVEGDVRLYLLAEPEMGRIDVNRGDPRVMRALLEKLADRGTASRALDAMRVAKERAQRIGATSGEEPPSFVSIDAWIAATGLDPTTADRIRPFVTAHTGAKAVNLFYAAQEVIDILPYLSRSQREQIARARKRSPQALMQVLAQIAPDPGNAEDTGDGDTTADGQSSEVEEPDRQVMRVTVEATVDGVLRRTERIVLAFTENNGGSGAVTEEAEAGERGLGRPDDTPAAASPPPYTILDRQILDSTMAATAQAATAPEEAGP
jgi:type II secretory pathway component PulK